ncbi:hypothetical protein GEMRC1_009406 [Eukaryota sp. GEM-RC1]
MFGGILTSHSSSFLSNTSTRYLVLDGFDFFLFSHILIVTVNISWPHGVFSMDNSSTLRISNVQSNIDGTPELPGNTRIFVWGGNSDGKLGTGSTTTVFSPSHVVLPLSVREVTLGSGHSLVLLANGDVYSCCSNIFGQRGRGGSMSAHKFNRVDIPKAFQVIAGEHSSFALMDDGTFYCWGRNDYHQLGLDPVSTVNQFVPVHNDYIDDVIKLSGTRNSFFALISNGDVYSWGHNPAGCLCLGHDENVNRPQLIKDIPPVNSTKPQLFNLDIRFTFIHTTSTSAVGIDKDQKLWSWGENSEGSLGDGTTDPSSTPYEIACITHVLSVSMAYDHTASIDTDGTLFTWGSNQHGRIGRTASTSDARFPGAIPHFSKDPLLVVVCNRDATTAYEKLSLGVPPGFKGNGSLVLDSSELQLISMTASLSQILLYNSVLNMVNSSLENVKCFNLSFSTAYFTQFSHIIANQFLFYLIHSDLYLEEEVVVTSLFLKFNYGIFC